VWGLLNPGRGLDTVPTKAVQNLKNRVNTVRYRDTKGKTRNGIVTATNGAGGVTTIRLFAPKQSVTTTSKMAAKADVDVYDNRN
jgi:hypothetical protein